MNKPFFISRNQSEREDYIKQTPGKKLIIYNGANPFEHLACESIDMNRLMDNEYYLTSLPLCDSDTTLILLDVLIKHGVYVHPYGRIFKFTGLAKTTCIIDSFIFKWDERQIVRPFLFIDTSVLGCSLTNFMASEKKLESYVDLIRDFIDVRVDPLEVEVINYAPTDTEKTKYDALKRSLISETDARKNHIVCELIKFVDKLDSKAAAIAKHRAEHDALVIISNHPKQKFRMYEALRNPEIGRVVFFSSGAFGADEIELSKTKDALIRHNELIRRLRAIQSL